MLVCVGHTSVTSMPHGVKQIFTADCTFIEDHAWCPVYTCNQTVKVLTSSGRDEVHWHRRELWHESASALDKHTRKHPNAFQRAQSAEFSERDKRMRHEDRNGEFCTLRATLRFPVIKSKSLVHNVFLRGRFCVGFAWYA